MTDQQGQVLVAALIGLTVLAILSEWLPRTLTLVRYWRHGNGLGALRRSTWIKSLGFLLIALLGLLVRLDAVCCDQAHFGRFAARWRLDAAFWFVAMVGACYVAITYWRILREHDRAADDEHGRVS